MFNSVNLSICGKKKIVKKDGGVIYKYSYVSDPYEKDYDGSQAGEVWSDQEFEIGEVVPGYLGYNKAGKYGIVNLG